MKRGTYALDYFYLQSLPRFNIKTVFLGIGLQL